MMAAIPLVTTLLIDDRQAELRRRAAEDRLARRLARPTAPAWAARLLSRRGRSAQGADPAPAREFVAPADWGAPRTGGVTFPFA